MKKKSFNGCSDRNWITLWFISINSISRYEDHPEDMIKKDDDEKDASKEEIIGEAEDSEKTN